MASPARATSVSRENNLQSSRETDAILARNESNSREKWKCFSRETRVFLARFVTVSREKWIILSKGGCFSVGSHAFAVREAWSLGSMPKSLRLLGDWAALRAAHESRTKGHEKWFGGSGNLLLILQPPICYNTTLQAELNLRTASKDKEWQWKWTDCV